MFLGRRKPYAGSLQSPFRWRETLNTCVVQPYSGRASRAQPSQNTLPEDDGARIALAEKRKNPLSGDVCLLTTGVLISVRQAAARTFRFACAPLTGL